MLSKGKILVVDDDRLVLATLAHGLSQAGYDVIDADNGDDAILLAREHRPDLALLDIRMQGKSGFDVAEYLRDYGQVPFMFLSAFADDATAAKVRELGAVAYLVKPLDVGQILPVVQRVLEARAPAVPADAPVVWMAIGILMERHALARGPAFARLEALAGRDGDTPLDQALRLVDALEAGAPPG